MEVSTRKMKEKASDELVGNDSRGLWKICDHTGGKLLGF